jgi:hypothetical protein
LVRTLLLLGFDPLGLAKQETSASSAQATVHVLVASAALADICTQVGTEVGMPVRVFPRVALVGIDGIVPRIVVFGLSHLGSSLRSLRVSFVSRS